MAAHTEQLDLLRLDELTRENDARIELKLDGAYVGLFEWNIVANTSKWSTGFYLLHGLAPGGSASYELWRRQVHPNDIGRVEAELQRAVAERAQIDMDYRIFHPTGELRWTNLKAAVRLDASGNPIVMSGYCGDITRRKLADAALLETHKLAITGQMSAAIAHEINNPLEAAYNLLYLARVISANEDQTKLLEQVDEQLRRVSEITHQTLRFSRPSQPRLVSVPEMVIATLRLLGPKIDSSSMKVETEFRAAGELMCSPGELQQILTNLLNNAAEASSESRQLRIRVTDAQDRNAQRGVRITIADTGPGMPPEVFRRFREPFFTTKDGAGTGLGMWVVQELLAKRGATMALRTASDPKRHGTVFALFFPYQLKL